MKMYREPLNYSVWRGNWNDNEEFIKQELIAYFADADRAKAYTESLDDITAVFDVDKDMLIYPHMDDLIY